MSDHEQTLTHGQVGYLQIPASDQWRSAEFYATVFGWHVERPYPSFEAPGLIGQWIDDRPPAADAGPLLWINVDRIEETLELVAGNGGAVLEAPALDNGERWLATARDPAGNTIGIFQLAQH
jgi:predicted enzyme related to lactoylglutathione lyase